MPSGIAIEPIRSVVLRIEVGKDLNLESLPRASVKFIEPMRCETRWRNCRKIVMSGCAKSSWTVTAVSPEKIRAGVRLWSRRENLLHRGFSGRRP